MAEKRLVLSREIGPDKLLGRWMLFPLMKSVDSKSTSPLFSSASARRRVNESICLVYTRYSGRYLSLWKLFLPLPLYNVFVNPKYMGDLFAGSSSPSHNSTLAVLCLLRWNVVEHTQER